jgi:hemoglobin
MIGTLDNSAANRSAEAVRARKRAEAEVQGIDRVWIARLVDSFYARVRADDLLAPIFAARIADWPGHLGRMNQFWRSVLHGSGEFSGNPMLKHLMIPGLQERHFERWLELFYATLGDLESCPQAALTAGTRARTIAASLLIGIETQRSGIAAAHVARELPHVQP